MFRIALHGSSFVGSRYGYQSPGTWEQCVQSLSAYFEPVDTFARRFNDLLTQVERLGFTCVDVWQPAVLNWQWAAPQHVLHARDLFAQHRMGVSSLAGEFGVTRKDFLSACALASAIGAKILSGTTALLMTDRSFVIDTLSTYDLQLAIENEVEFTPAEMLEQIGDGAGGRIGTALDTGWWATHQYDVVQAIRELNGHIFHVHLKDVLPGDEHINCGYGKGCVPIEECIRTLMEIGYSGVVSVENHTLDHDPDQELIAGRQLLEKLLGGKE